MKKLKVVTGGLVVLGGAWLGLTWYSGKLAENYYQSNIDIIKANIYQSVPIDFDYTTEININDESYSRNFFSSDLTFTVEITSEYDHISIEIPVKSKIYHGPFPINELKSFNLMPKMFSAITQVEKTEHTKPLFDIIPSEEPISVTSSASYSGTISGSLLINAGEYSLDRYTFIKWKPLQTNFSYNSYDKNKIKGNMDIPLMNFEMSYAGDKTNILVEALTYKLDFKNSELENIWIGEGGISTKQISFKLEHSDEFINFDIKNTNAIAKIKNTKQPNFIDIAFTFDIDNLSANNSKNNNSQNFGSFKFNNSLNHLYAPAMNNLIERLIIQRSALFNDSDLFKSIKDIVQNQPAFSIDPLMLTNNEGKVKLETQLNLKKLDDELMNDEELLDDEDFINDLTLIDLFEKLNINNEISKSYVLSSAKKLLTFFDNKKETKKEIEEKANSFVNEFWNDMKKYEDFIEISEDKLEFKLFIKDNKLYLNKKEITKEEQNYYKSFVLMFLPILLR